MQTEIDEYAEANLEELYVALTNDFYKKTYITAQRSMIWNNLFENINKSSLEDVR